MTKRALGMDSDDFMDDFMYMTALTALADKSKKPSEQKAVIWILGLTWIALIGATYVGSRRRRADADSMRTPLPDRWQ